MSFLWQNRKKGGCHAYAYLDGIALKRTWADEVRNVSILFAFSINEDGFREILRVAEEAKEEIEFSELNDIFVYNLYANRR